jgi:serine/threonine protein kinase
MSSERWERIEQLFERALDQPTWSRDHWLAAEAPDDPELRAEVIRLLGAHERTGGILDRGLPPLVYDVADHLQRALGERYRVERELGHGGSAIVYQAHESKHGRRVVLKVLKPEVAAVLGTDRFLREVQIAARLAHPHILGLIDSGSADGLLFYVMPFVQGETLRHRLERGPMAQGESLTLLRDIADAVTYAHDAGVVHRDLKPENIWCSGGHAFVMDFGIAKVLEGTEGFASVTETDQSIGTPAYMAPEQAVGDRAIDHRVDIYAWGLIAHEMLTGRRPALPKARNTPVNFAISVPRELQQLIETSLAPEPARRTAEMRDIRDALDRLVSPSHPPQPGARRTVAVVAGAVVLAIAAIAIWMRPREAAAVPAPVAVTALTNETSDTSLATWGRLAGDWLTQGIQETGLVAVIPWPSAAQASEVIARERSNGDVDIVKRMREETGAGLVVTCSYYLLGDSVHFQAQVANAATGALYGALPPVAAHRRQPEVAVRELRARLMGQMAVWFDERLSELAQFSTQPPTFEAYRAFDSGMELYLDQRYSSAADEFRRAHESDPSFLVARLYESICLWNTGRFSELEAALARLAEGRSSLSEYHELQLRAIESLMKSDRASALESEERASRLAPGSKAAYNLALHALDLNRPAVALAALESLDPDRGSMRGWSSYWTALAHARHLLGDHRGEAAAAREMRTRYADRRVAWVLEARALAAGRRLAELDSLLAMTAALPERTYWSHGAALVVAGEELLAHGADSLAMIYFRQGEEWLTPRQAAAPDYSAYREWLGASLYGQQRWVDAAALLAPFARDTSVRYQLRALPVLARFRATGGQPPKLPDGSVRDSGEVSAYRARLAAIAGDTVQAIEHLATALRLGIDGFPWLHGSAHRDLAPLKAEPRFQRLMAIDSAR